MAKVVRADQGVMTQAAFGGPSTGAVGTGPLLLTGLAARAVEPLLSLDAAGNVRSGILAPGDIPSQFTRRDVAEPISQSWRWGTDTVLWWSGSGQAPPSISTVSIGTRIKLEAVGPGNADYAFGIESATLWSSVPGGGIFKWYNGNVCRMRLDYDGTLFVENGSGIMKIAGTHGYASIDAVYGLSLTATQGTLYLIPHGMTAAGTYHPSAGVVLPSLPYTVTLGHPTQKFLALHCGELWVETLVAQDTMATVGGRVLVGPTTSLVLPLPADPVEYVAIFTKHNNMGNGDLLMLQAHGKFEMFTVNAVVATHPPNATIPFTHYEVHGWRNQDGSGYSAWDAGDAVFNTGTIGNGFIDLYSIQGASQAPGSPYARTTYGPTIVGNVRVDTTAVGWLPRWAIGNLGGLYGNAAGVYGVAFGRPDQGLHLQVDDTFGIRVLDQLQTAYASFDMSGNLKIGRENYPNVLVQSTGVYLRRGVDTTMWLDGTTGNLSLIGSIVVGAAATIRSAGAAAWNAGFGYHLQATAGGNATFLLGDAATNRIQFDGTNFYIKTQHLRVHPVYGVNVAITAPTGGGTGGYPAGYGYGFDIAYGGGCAMFANEFNDPTIGNAKTRRVWIANDTGNAGDESCNAAISFGVNSWGSLSSAIIDLESYSNWMPPVAQKPSKIKLRAADIYTDVGVLHTGTLVTGGSITSVGDASLHCGTHVSRWYGMYTLHLGVALPYGIGVNYRLQMGEDSAAKPISSTWIVPSDRRVKRDVEAVDGARALDIVRATRLVHYTYNGEHGTPDGARGIGVEAEQAAGLLPHSVTPSTDGILGWNAHDLLMLNVVAVQELARRLDALDAKEGGR